MNEYIFLSHAIFVGASAVGALVFGSAGLTTFVATQCVLANFFVLKQITLFGLSATCSDAYTIGATIGLNLLQEFFGKKAAKQAIGINFFMLILYAIVSQIHLWYIPSAVDTTQAHYYALLQVTPRIIIASFSVFLFTQMLDYHLYGFLKNKLKDRYLLIRNYASIVICQAIDTILFGFLGLYGIIDNLWEVMLVSYFIKLIAIVVATPFVWASRPLYDYLNQKIRF